MRSRVRPFQPTILLDGLIVSLAAGALAAVLMDATFLNDIEASTAAITLKVAYPLGAVILLTFALWVQAVTGWRPNRTWTAAVVGLALAGDLVDRLPAAHGVRRLRARDARRLAVAGRRSGARVCRVAAARGSRCRCASGRTRRLGATSLGAAVALAVLVLGQFLSVGFAAVTLAAAALVALISRAAVAFKESRQMFADARNEAQTDALTTLGNRRKLMTDLQRELQVASVGSPRILVMFDLDGFKRYNDTYGHPAGDVLLARLGSNLERAIKPYGQAYRIGGDEFCVLVMTGASSAKTIIALAASALSEQGEGFAIKASHGTVMLPHEARDATLALRVADQRMYAQKEDRRSSATRQARDILLQVLHEREPALGNHLKGVANLALGVGTRLSLIPEELDEVVRAAELHDVGKMAIPDEILQQAGPAEPGGVGLRAAAHARRRAHPERRAGPAARRQDRALEPGALGRLGLPGRRGRRGDPARGTHRGGVRRVRRDDHLTSVPRRPIGGGGPGGAARLLRHAVRPGGRGGVLRADRVPAAPVWNEEPSVCKQTDGLPCYGRSAPQCLEPAVQQLPGLRGRVVGAQQHHAQLDVSAPRGRDDRAAGPDACSPSSGR